MKIVLTRKEISKLYYLLKKNESKTFKLVQDHSTGIGVGTTVIFEDDTTKDITDYSSW